MTTKADAADGPPKDPELGVYASGMRLLRTKEAVRHGELRLAAQRTNRTGLETRATAIIGWAVPIALGTLTLLLSPLRSRVETPAMAVFACLALAGAFAIAALWPRKWEAVGLRPVDLLKSDAPSELSLQQMVAEQYWTGVRTNAAQLKLMGGLVTAAWCALVAAPVLAVVTADWR